MRALRRVGHFTSPSSQTVFDIWESQADLDAFGPVLMPILSNLDVGLNPPVVAKVRCVING